ncbi:glycosyltransferase family 2 protein [Planctomycetaceae bacterium SH139]
MTLPLTVVVLTFNEEVNLPACLDSLRGRVDDVHVLDSGSSDRTLEIANSYHVPVHHNPFAGFGQQRNWAIDHIDHAHPWTLHLDADERLTTELVAELTELLAANPPEAGFYVPNKLIFGDKWLRYSSGYPIYQVRLFHRQRLRFEDHGHGQREVTEGKLRYLQEPYLHEAYNKGLDDWFAKHAKYARAEAELLFANNLPMLDCFRKLVSGGSVERRRALKSLAYRLPFRPNLRMFYSLVVKQGIRDGRSGIAYARLLAAYESMIDAHLSRLKAGIRL